MIEWISSNLANIIIVAILLIVVAFVVRKLIKDKKAGKCSCGNSCGSCSMSGQCHNARK